MGRRPGGGGEGGEGGAGREEEAERAGEELARVSPQAEPAFYTPCE